jgi:serine/threonine protein kinase
MSDSLNNPPPDTLPPAAPGLPADCAEFSDAQIQMAIDGRLTDDLVIILSDHLCRCPVCRARFRHHLASIDQKNNLIEIFEEPPVAAAQKVVAQLKQIQPRVTEFKPGDSIGPYLVIDHIGKGGFSSVYDCTDTQLGRRVAVKVLTHRKFNDTQLARLEQEAWLLAKLDHPGIVKAYEIKPFHDPPFIVMERVAGGTVRELLANGPLAPRLAAQLLENVARALDHAHKHGVIHRDIKPSNLLLVESYKPGMQSELNLPLKLSDFGLAKPLERNSELTLSDTLIGTPAYMSPEQTRGKPGDVGTRSDIYTMGVLLYEFLIGKPPLVSDNVAETLRMINEIEPVSPRRLLRQIPRDLETICLKCLRKLPEERYASAFELAEDLKRFLENRPVAVRPISPAGKVYRWCKRNRPLAAALGCIFTLFVTIVALAINFAIVQKNLRESAEASARLDRQIAIEAGMESDYTRNRMYSSVQYLTNIAKDLSQVQNNQDAMKLAEKAKAYNHKIIETYLRRPITEQGLSGIRIDIYFRDAIAMRELGFTKISMEMLQRIIKTAEQSQPGDKDYFALIAAGNRSAPALAALLEGENRNDEARSLLISAWRNFRIDYKWTELSLMNLLERRALIEKLLQTTLEPPDDTIISHIKAEQRLLSAEEKRFTTKSNPSK